jgi:hypothetical protein
MHYLMMMRPLVNKVECKIYVSRIKGKWRQPQVLLDLLENYFKTILNLKIAQSKTLFLFADVK